MVNFIPTSKWEQASFKYSLAAGTSLSIRFLQTLQLESEAALCLRGVLMGASQQKRNTAAIQLTSRTIVSDFILEIPPSKADLK